jgi:cytochrome P460
MHTHLGYLAGFGVCAAVSLALLTDCATHSASASGPQAATGSAHDKYTVQVPNGLAFSDFRGYENWQVVAVSQTDDLLKVMVANSTMIDAYRAGIPLNGAPFPEGSKIAKIEWKPKKNTEAPFAVRIPDVLQDVFLIEKDSSKFPSTKGWAYAAFDYDAKSDTFTPDKTGSVACGFACHTGVAKKDYIFTAYGYR